MRYIIVAFLCLVPLPMLPVQSYVDALDLLIDQHISVVGSLSTEIKDYVYCITASVKKKSAHQDMHDVLVYENLLLYKLQNSIEKLSLQASCQDKQALQDLKFAVSAKIYCHYLVCFQAIMMDFALKIYQAIAYWQDVKFKATRQDVTVLFLTVDYQNKISKSLDALQLISKQVYTYLGIINYNQSILQQAENKEKFQQYLLVSLQLQDDFFSTPFQDYNLQNLEIILENYVSRFTAYNCKITSEYVDHRLPSYVERYWQSCLATMAVSSASGCIGYSYQDRLHHFFTEHIKLPVERNIDVLTGAVQFPQLDTSENEATLKALIELEFQSQSPLGKETSISDALQSQADRFSDGKALEVGRNVLKISQMYDDVVKLNEQNKEVSLGEIIDNIVNAILKSSESKEEVTVDNSWQNLPQNLCWNWPKDFLYNRPKMVLGKKPFAVLAEYLKKEEVVEKSDKFVQSNVNASDEETVKEVARRDIIILAHPIKNIEKVMPAYSRKFEREIMGIKNQVNQFAKDMYVVLGVATLIPVMSVIAGGLFASTKVYNSVAYKPIRKFMREIDIFLNESFYELSNFEKQGHLYFLVEQLKLYVGLLTVHEQELMQQDIAALQSNTLDYVQKFHIVQRMYRTYPCLAFH